MRRERKASSDCEMRNGMWITWVNNVLSGVLYGAVSKSTWLATQTALDSCTCYRKNPNVDLLFSQPAGSVLTPNLMQHTMPSRWLSFWPSENSKHTKSILLLPFLLFPLHYAPLELARFIVVNFAHIFSRLWFAKQQCTRHGFYRFLRLQSRCN